MSIYHSAQLVYGVPMTEDEVAATRQLPEWDDIYDNWGIKANLLTGDNDTLIIGIVEDAVEEGEATELGNIHEPRTKDIEDLLEVLDILGIDREPTWHLMCSVS